MTQEIPNPVRLTRFKVQFDGGAATATKKIYANGNMQVRVNVILAAVDANGRPEILPPSIYNSVRLIDYKTGELLSDGWVADERPNLYAQALYGVSADWKAEDPVDPFTRIRSFWVSSTVATEIEVGAVVIFNDTVIRTNNTTLRHKFDSRVIIEGDVPVTHELSRFRLSSVVVDDTLPDCVISHFYLNLNVDGRHMDLLGWSDAGGAEHSIFPGSITALEAHGDYDDGSGRWRSICVFAGVKAEEVVVWLKPVEAMSRGKLFTVPVNDRRGALSIVLGAGRDFSGGTYNSSGAFYFTAFDVFGTGHRLSLRFRKSISVGSLVLEKA